MAHFEIDYLRLIIQSKIWVGNQHLIGILLDKLIKRGRNNDFAAEFLATAFEDEEQLMDPIINRQTLQLLVDSGFWKKDKKLMWFIYDNIVRVSKGNLGTFGSREFWGDVFDNTDESQFGTGSVQEFYEISESSRLTVKRFKCQANSYEIHFKNFQDSSNTALILENIFDDILKKVLSRDNGSKYRIGVDISHPKLSHKVLLPFVPPDQMNGAQILNKIEAVQQSEQEFEVGEQMQLKVVIVDSPQGAGTNTVWKNARSRIINWDQWFQKHCGHGGCFIQIKNEDQLCLARALVVARAKVDNSLDWNSIRQGREIQHRLAQELMNHSGLGEHHGSCGLDELKIIQAYLKDYQIKVFSKDNFGQLIYKGPQAPKLLHLYHHDEHFDVISRMPAFMGKTNFCEACNKGFWRQSDHMCSRGKCPGCNGKDPCPKDAWCRCEACNRWFTSKTCLANHKMERVSIGNKFKRVQSICDRLKRCKDCGQLMKLNKQKTHKCFQYFCHTCRSMVDRENHECYIKTVKDSDKKQRQPKFIFFDLETRQDKDLAANKWGPVRKHVPNCCVAYRVCKVCIPKGIGSCEACGGSNRHTFMGENCLNEFGHWLFSEEHKGFTVLAHNARGFDSQFILEYLHSQKTLPPNVISKGLELMMLEAGDVRIIDTLNFLPMPLAAFPKTFGLKEMKKGYFPHLFNTMENWNYIGEIPKIEFYNPDSMKEDAREEFLDWHSKKSANGTLFDLQKELVSYCESDVDILMNGALKFREIFISETGVDPFLSSLTIASACNYVYRRNFLRDNTIGIIPHGGYRRRDKQSIIALKWLKWIANKNNIQIHHKLNGGEVKIGPYKADGLCGNTIYEFYGCWWHGCPNCMKNRNEPLLDSKMTAEESYQSTIERRLYLEAQGYIVVEKWECELKQELQRDTSMKNFFDSIKINEPLGPRDAFYGGRTNAIKLYHKCQDGEQIDYVDVCSLYPWVCKMGLFPIKHPKIITENFDNLENRPYTGIIKCTIIPPRKLFHPLLPYRFGGKLLFPLCRSCINDPHENCSHTEEERALTGAWVTLEIYKALDLGYKVIDVLEVWHYKETSQYDPKTKTGGLFADYINTFLRLKQQADGWPAENMSFEEKDAYISNYEMHEGIRLVKDQITKNNGMRTLAKLMLNSFWGKFGQRNNLSQTEYFTEPEKFFRLVFDEKVTVPDIRFYGDSMACVTYTTNDEFLDALTNTNAVIASFVTSQARLKLYTYIEKLQERVLYMDTDSVIYLTNTYSKAHAYRVPIGCYLGEMTNELKTYGDGAYIDEFVAGGPKNYAYRICNDQKNIVSEVNKVRGFRLTFKNKKTVNFDTLKRMVIKFVLLHENDIKTIYDKKIQRDKERNVYTAICKKDYRVVYTKRQIFENFYTYPYGY